METLPGSSDEQNQVDESLSFRIRVKGHLDNNWADWFDSLTINNKEDGNAILSGTTQDQAALLGVINRISSLGMTIISLVVRDKVEQMKQKEEDDG